MSRGLRRTSYSRRGRLDDLNAPVRQHALLKLGTTEDTMRTLVFTVALVLLAGCGAGSGGDSGDQASGSAYGAGRCQGSGGTDMLGRDCGGAVGQGLGGPRAYPGQGRHF
jgi:hypothetical protein